MNERIRELYNQCFVELKNDVPNVGFDFERFAELIIGRCATVADFAHLGGVIEPGAMVKEYFGVE